MSAGKQLHHLLIELPAYLLAAAAAFLIAWTTTGQWLVGLLAAGALVGFMAWLGPAFKRLLNGEKSQ